jgi:hypothetical protein
MLFFSSMQILILRTSERSRGVKLTIHLYLVPSLRMRGAILPLSHTSSWPDAWLIIGKISPLLVY